jgi:hypothetical protein
MAEYVLAQDDGRRLPRLMLEYIVQHPERVGGSTPASHRAGGAFDATATVLGRGRVA